MTVRRFVVPVTVNSSGDATVYTAALSGKVHSIRYVKGDFANTADFVITSDLAGETIWSEENVTVSATRYPRAVTHSTAGAAALYASGGTNVNDKIALSADRVKIVVAAAGNGTSGTFHITVDD